MRLNIEDVAEAFCPSRFAFALWQKGMCNHRWSWFESDLDAQGNALLATMRKTSWDGGYDVAFPGLVRHLSTPYVSLASADFDAALRRELPAEVIRCHCRP